MDWSSAAVFITAIVGLVFLIVILGIFKVAMWIVRSAARTTKKTAHVLTAPFNPRR